MKRNFWVIIYLIMFLLNSCSVNNYVAIFSDEETDILFSWGKPQVMSFSIDGRFIAYCEFNRSAKSSVLYIEDRISTIVKTIDIPFLVYELRWSPKTNYLAMAGLSGDLMIMDANNTRVLSSKKITENAVIRVDWSGNKSVLLVSSSVRNNEVSKTIFQIYSVPDLVLLSEIFNGDSPIPIVLEIAWNSDEWQTLEVLLKADNGFYYFDSQTYAFSKVDLPASSNIGPYFIFWENRNMFIVVDNSDNGAIIALTEGNKILKTIDISDELGSSGLVNSAYHDKKRNQLILADYHNGLLLFDTSGNNFELVDKKILPEFKTGTKIYYDEFGRKILICRLGQDCTLINVK